MKFHSPYQFIPVDTSKAKHTTWKPDQALSTVSTHIRHDYWGKDNYSGQIHCTLSCQSPLVIGAKQEEGSKEIPSSVTAYRLPSGKQSTVDSKSGAIAIPANSLRGMIASIVETISQSALRVLVQEKDSDYSYRKTFPKGVLTNIGILSITENGTFIYPLKSRQDCRGVEINKTRHYKCYHHGSNQEFVYLVGDNIRKNGQESEKGILYIRGDDSVETKKHMPKNRKNETFIPWDGILADKKYLVPEITIEQTERMLRRNHNRFQQLPKGYEETSPRDWKDETSHILQDGDLIYYQQQNDEITELSYSVIWRKPTKGRGLYHAFKNTGGKNALPWSTDRDQLTAAEALFGVVEESPEKNARNLASRVRFSDGLEKKPLELMGEVTLKILASPKPPSPSMYFRTTENRYIAKNSLDLDKHVPNGRKYYLPHPESKHQWQSSFEPGSEHNFKTHLKCRPIPPTSSFSFIIDYENLSQAELGLLRTALEPSEGFIHRLGLGKPLGLGQVSIKIDRIEKIDRVNRYQNLALNATRYEIEDLSLDQTLVDNKTLKLLQTLGNPDNCVAPINYPFSSSKEQNHNSEEQGFEWFVNNDNLNNENQVLPPLQAGQKWPTLDSN